MSCYMRHLHWLFEALERPYDKYNRTELDSTLRQILGLDASNTCYEVWAAIKALPDEEQSMLPQRVNAFEQHAVDEPETTEVVARGVPVREVVSASPMA